MSLSPDKTSRLIHLSKNELVAIEMIKHCRRSGNYTEVLIWGETLWRQIWDADEKLWNEING